MMIKLRYLSIYIFVSISGIQLFEQLVECKPQLCHPSPNWTINGINRMKDSLGNVTLVTLLNASFKFGIKQALSMENMLKFLKSTGLKDFHFIIINANEFDASLKLKEVSEKVSFAVYQETDSESVWETLDGGKDDMFIYDRCGRLTYYIPFPLSIIHAQQPILQAALLSTYFDNPCGETCDLEESLTISPTIDTSLTSRPLALKAMNMTLSESLFEPKTFEQTSSTITTATDDLESDEVFTFAKEESSDNIVVEEHSGSGSGEQAFEDLFGSNGETVVTTQIEDLVSQENVRLDEKVIQVEKDVKWKIYDFFKSKSNRSDQEIYDEIYNASNPDINVNDYERYGSTSLQPSISSISETTYQTQSANTWTVTTVSSIVQSTTLPKRTRFSFFGSAARAKCDRFNQSMCAEWSTDRLLRARLCCLTEVLGNDEDSGFGCRNFERSKCHRMLPVIKCCLKDFSQLLESYFQSVKKPSRQRNR